MSADLILDQRFSLDDGAIVQVKIWRVPEPVPPSGHLLKYSLFYGRRGQRLVGYDNERGKGDHQHVNGIEHPYRLVSIDRLLADFRADVEALRGQSL